MVTRAGGLSEYFYYGTRLLPDFSVGAALKYVRLQYAPTSLQGVGTTFAVDLGSLYRIPADPRLNHRAQIVGGVLADRCGAILTEFFAGKRERAKQ